MADEQTERGAINGEQKKEAEMAEMGQNHVAQLRDAKKALENDQEVEMPN